MTVDVVNLAGRERTVSKVSVILLLVKEKDREEALKKYEVLTFAVIVAISL